MQLRRRCFQKRLQPPAHRCFYSGIGGLTVMEALLTPTCLSQWHAQTGCRWQAGIRRCTIHFIPESTENRPDTATARAACKNVWSRRLPGLFDREDNVNPPP